MPDIVELPYSSCSSSITLPVRDKGSQSPATATRDAPSNMKLQSQGNGRPENPIPLDSLGLNLVYDCSNPLVDIIFVHGLGGMPIKTWSWQHDPQNFWPPWLGTEAELCRCRTFTFGYNADFPGQHTRLNILDFAKELLFGMKTYSNGRTDNDQPIGSVSYHVLEIIRASLMSARSRLSSSCILWEDWWSRKYKTLEPASFLSVPVQI